MSLAIWLALGSDASLVVGVVTVRVIIVYSYQLHLFLVQETLRLIVYAPKGLQKK
jgi:hypothetical protein